MFRAYLSPPIATPLVMGAFSVNMVRSMMKCGEGGDQCDNHDPWPRQVLNLAWIFVWDRSSVDGQEGLTVLAFLILLSIAISNIVVRMIIRRKIIRIYDHESHFTMLIPGDGVDGEKHHQVCRRVFARHSSLLV